MRRVVAAVLASALLLAAVASPVAAKPAPACQSWYQAQVLPCLTE